MTDDLATRLDERLQAMSKTLERIEKHLESVDGRIDQAEKDIVKLQTWVALVAGIGGIAVAVGTILSIVLR